MQLVLSNNRILAHGENFLAMGGVVINTETGAKYENATIAECSGCPSDIGVVGYEYHAGRFVPCAPFGKGTGNIAVYCDDCKTPRDSGVPIDKVCAASSYLAFVGNINEDMVAAAFGKNNEDEIVGVGKALAMYAKYKGETENVDYLNDYDKFSDIVLNHKADLTNTKTLFDFIKSSPYAYDKLVNTNTGLPDIVLYDRGITEYLDIPNATIYNFVKDEDEIYDGKNFSYSLDTNSNISIRKAVSNTVDLTKAFQYTLPLLKDLPKLSGYRYLNVKLSDDEESYVYIGTGDFSVTLGGIETTMYQCDEMLSWTEPDISLTGSLYKKDIFDNYASNPNSQEVAISIYLQSWSKKADDSRNRSAELGIHIDKIWISES